jgi:hypothetical protein
MRYYWKIILQKQIYIDIENVIHWKLTIVTSVENLFIFYRIFEAGIKKKIDRYLLALR